MENTGFDDDPQSKKRTRMQRSMSVHPDLVSRVSQSSMVASFKRTLFKTSSVRWKDDLKIDIPSPDGCNYVLSDKSPPDEVDPFTYNSNEGGSTELSVQVCSDSIRQSLMEQGRQAPIKILLFDDIVSPDFTSDDVPVVFADSSDLEKNMCFLWAAFHRRWDLFEPLLEAGADLNFRDAESLTAIHISSFVGCYMGTEFLISKGADVNSVAKCFSPLHYAVLGNQPEVAKLLISKGAIASKTYCDESPLHCAVRANSPECLKILMAENIDINSIEPSGFNSVHLAAELGMSMCLEVLLQGEGVDVDVKTSLEEKKMTALHLAADEGSVECVKLLLDKGANHKLTNSRGATPLHLAAKCFSPECVELLLKNYADSNAMDVDKRTPLFAAIGKSDLSFEIIEMLINWGANINHKDQYGFTPLHLAALDGLSSCVETLIFHGADITTKVNKGNSALNVILRKTPSSLGMIVQKLDAAITLHHSHDSTNREVELELDFRNILQHCHPREISYLNTFVEEGKKEVLLHPLCSAFLYIKWEKIRKYFFARFIFYLIFVSLLTLYVYTILAVFCPSSESVSLSGSEKLTGLCSNDSSFGNALRDNPFKYTIQWWFLLIFTIIEIFYKSYGVFGYPTMKQYISHMENIVEIMVIISVFIICHGYINENNPWQIQVGVAAVLGGWTNLMLMIGQLPVFGSYVAMYQKVQKEFGKLFLAYSCILIGFTFSFCIVFPTNDVFPNPFMGFITMLTMMIGEVGINELFGAKDWNNKHLYVELSAQIIYVLFVVFVTVVLMNLLVGIAVHDIQGLKQTAGLSKLVRQTKLISKIELALIQPFIKRPNFLMKILYSSALVSPQAYRVVLSVKPLNPAEKRLPRDIMLAAYELSKKPKSCSRTLSSRKSRSMYLNSLDYKNKSEECSCNLSLQMMHSKTEEDDSISTQIEELKRLVNSQQKLLQAMASKMDKHFANSSSDC